jgi:uncharacterized protein
MSNRVTHFEVPCDNPEQTMNFFKEVFGWTFQKFGDMPYWTVITGDDKSPGINGGFMKKNDPNQPVVTTIEVAHIDEAMTKIEKAKGKIVVPKMPIPAVGWLAYFKDPDGNIHGVYENDPGAK